MALVGPSRAQVMAGMPPGNERQRAFRRALRYTGPGDYWSDIQSWGKRWIPKGSFSSAGKWLGGVAGSALGPEGTAAGGMLGGLGGQALANYVGFGDYSNPTVHNQIIGSSDAEAQNIASVNSTDLSGDIYISHTEFLQNVNVTYSNATAGTSNFQQLNIQINPGIVQSFPFLSQIAANFEMYDFQGLIYQYKPNSGESGAAANSLGKVIMATNYDPDAPAFINSVQMQNYDYSASCKPSCGMVHGVETKNTQQAVNMMYVRTGPTTKDKIFTDIGTFTIGTEGIPFPAGLNQNQIIGELWVTYRIKLSRANLYTAMLGLNQPLTCLKNTSTAASIWPALTGTALTNATWPGSSDNWTVAASTTTPAKSLVLTGRSNLLAGCYQFVIYARLPAVYAGGNTIIVSMTPKNCSLINVPITDTTQSTVQIGQIATTELTGVWMGMLSVSNPLNQGSSLEIEFNNGLNGIANNFITVTISQVPCTISTTAWT